MRKLLYISLALMLVTMAMGCGRSVDERLVLADSLMWTAPDSSLAILNAIDRDSLGDDENLAYHALLLTQAQFRCNIPLTSDTLISTAVDYYSDNHNREHYTRALLYKGGAYEDMGNPVEAIKWYKKAEDNADTTDYRNLAQINMRMGKIYNNSYITTGEDISKFKKALYYYRKLRQRELELLCLLYIGEKMRVSSDPKTVEYLLQAKDLATELRDTVSIVNSMQILSRHYLYDSCYAEAHRTNQLCIASYPNHITEDIILDEARVFAKLGETDSAAMYLNLVKSPIAYDMSHVYRLYTIADISLAKGDKMQYIKNKRIADSICDVVQIKRDRLKLPQEERILEEQHLKQSKSRNSLFALMFVFLVALIVIVVVAFYLYYSKKRKEWRNLIVELKQEQQITDSLIVEYKEKTSTDGENKELHSAIVSYLEQHFNSLKSLIEKSNSMKHSDFVKLLKERSSQLGANNEMSKLLIMLADDKYNNLISKFSELYPSLNENELKIISLISLGYHNEEIAFCTGMEVPSVRTKKTRIKIKMKLPMSLDAFVTQEKLKHSS